LLKNGGKTAGVTRIRKFPATTVEMGRIVLLFALCVSVLSAQDWAKQKLEKSTRHGEWVTVKHDGRSVEAYVVYPEVANKAPVVLVIHEIFGLSDWAQLAADEFAAAGYIAIAPDLLSGKGPNGGGTKGMDQTAINQAIRDLPPDQITADLNAAADYALKQPAASGKLFVAGFCYGGGQSFRYATNRPDVKGAFVFYGTPPADDTLSRIKAPIYGFYGGNDARVTATVDTTKPKMAAAGKTYEPVVFEGAGHGFMRGGEDPTSTAATHAADVKARDQAWVRMKEALAKLSR
jgi:carboxymethylenebutenolidase